MEQRIRKTGINFIGEEEHGIYQWIKDRAFRNYRSFSSEAKLILREAWLAEKKLAESKKNLDKQD